MFNLIDLKNIPIGVYSDTRPLVFLVNPTANDTSYLTLVLLVSAVSSASNVAVTAHQTWDDGVTWDAITATGSFTTLGTKVINVSSSSTLVMSTTIRVTVTASAGETFTITKIRKLSITPGAIVTAKVSAAALAGLATEVTLAALNTKVTQVAATPLSVRLSDGANFYSASNSFQYEGSSTLATYDTATPANNRAIPNLIMKAQGEAPYTAGTHTVADSFPVVLASDQIATISAAATPLSNRLSDGSAFYVGAKTEQLPTTVGSLASANSLSVTLSSDEPAIAVDTGLQVNSGIITVSTLRNTPATDAVHLLNTRHEAAITPISVRLSSGAAFSDAVTVSGSVTANAGTNLNTSALALEAGGNLAGIYTNTTLTKATGVRDANTQRVTIATDDVVPVTNAAMTSIDGKMAALGQKNMAGSMPVVFASDQSALTVNAGTNLNTSALALETGGNLAAIKTAIEILDDTVSTNVHTGLKELQIVATGHVCAENSTTTELAGGGVFTGSIWQDCLNYGTIVVSVTSDQNSATNGLVVQWSPDGTAIMDTDSFTILANIPKSFSFGTSSRYIRVVYTNGATLQGNFILQTMLKPGYTKPSSHRIDEAIVGQDDAELVKAVLTGKNPAGAFVNVTTTTAGNMKVSVEEFDSGALGQDVMANSLPVTIASNQSAIPVTTTEFAKVLTPQLIAGNTILGSAGAGLAVGGGALGVALKAVHVFDTTGKAIGIYDGDPATTGVLITIVGPGCDAQVNCPIVSGKTIYLRSMEAAGGSASDYFVINYLG